MLLQHFTLLNGEVPTVNLFNYIQEECTEEGATEEGYTRGGLEKAALREREGNKKIKPRSKRRS